LKGGENKEEALTTRYAIKTLVPTWGQGQSREAKCRRDDGKEVGKEGGVGNIEETLWSCEKGLVGVRGGSGFGTWALGKLVKRRTGKEGGGGFSQSLGNGRPSVNSSVYPGLFFPRYRGMEGCSTERINMRRVIPGFHDFGGGGREIMLWLIARERKKSRTVGGTTIQNDHPSA